MKAWLIYFTAGSMAEARNISAGLVRRRMVACANILSSMRSIYWWRGAVEEGREIAVLAKTSSGRVREAIAAVRKQHSYEVPCIVAWPLARGYPPFMRWIADETKARPRRR